MIRMALIGCGAAGRNHLIEMIKNPEIDVVAVCDSRDEVLAAIKKDFAISRLYTSYVNMMESEELDAVSIVTPPDVRENIVLAAAKHRLHALCEKPLCLDIKQGETMKQAMVEAHSVLAVTFTYRFYYDTRMMKEIIDSGILGRILEVRYLRYEGAPEKPPEGSSERRRFDWFFSPQGQGVVFDCGIHGFDLLKWFAGAGVSDVWASGEYHMGYDYPDAATVVFHYNNGVKGTFDYGHLAPYVAYDTGGLIYQIMVTGRAGTMVWRYGHRQIDHAWHSTLTTYTKDGHNERIMPVHGNKVRDLQYQQFVSSVHAGKLQGYWGTVDEAIDATRIGLEVIQQCQARRRS